VRTGTIRVASIFSNPQYLLRPGMFSRVRAQLGSRRGPGHPQQAVTEIQGKYLVAVVSTDNKTAIKQVKVGERFGRLWVIEEGLAPGEKVVAEGPKRSAKGWWSTRSLSNLRSKANRRREEAESEPTAQSKPKKR